MSGHEGQPRRLGGSTITPTDLLRYILTLEEIQQTNGKLAPHERQSLVNRGFSKRTDQTVEFSDEKIAEVVDMPVGLVRKSRERFRDMQKR